MFAENFSLQIQILLWIQINFHCSIQTLGSKQTISVIIVATAGFVGVLLSGIATLIAWYNARIRGFPRGRNSGALPCPSFPWSFRKHQRKPQIHQGFFLETPGEPFKTLENKRKDRVLAFFRVAFRSLGVGEGIRNSIIRVVFRRRANREVQTVNWEGGGEGAVERGVKSSLKKAHQPWIRSKKGAQTVN